MLLAISIIITFILGFLAARSRAQEMAEAQWNDKLYNNHTTLTALALQKSAKALATTIVSMDLDEDVANKLYEDSVESMFKVNVSELPEEVRTLDECMASIRRDLVKFIEKE